MSDIKSVDNLYRLTTNPAIEMFNKQQRIFDSFNIASRIVSSSALESIANSGIQNYSEMISNSLSQMTNMSKKILESTVPVASVLQSITNVSETIRKGNLEAIWASTSRMQALSNSIMHNSQIENLSIVMEQFSKNILYTTTLANKVMVEACTQNMRSMAERIKMPIMTVSDIIGNLNWQDEIDFEDFDIEEDEKEDIIKETQNVIKETFSNIAEENILDLKDLQDKNSEQRWIEIWSKYKEVNPVRADILLKTYNYIINGFIKVVFGIIGTIIYMNLLMGKTQVIQSFEKTKDVSNDFTISDAKKEAKTIINKEYYPVKDNILNTYRYIDEDNIYIRESHKMEAYGVKKLEKGDVVEVQYQNDSKKRYKNWIYVQYEDKEGNLYEGWINNIYTKKIK